MAFDLQRAKERITERLEGLLGAETQLAPGDPLLHRRQDADRSLAEAIHQAVEAAAKCDLVSMSIHLQFVGQDTAIMLQRQAAARPDKEPSAVGRVDQASNALTSLCDQFIVEALRAECGCRSPMESGDA